MPTLTTVKRQTTTERRYRAHVGRLLRISSTLGLPYDAVTSTLVVYGSKGMGKSNLLAVVLEEMSKAALRWCVIDPVGVLWGLRHAADGRGDGVPVLILGGIHGDLPITPESGEIVADLVADENVNVIIDCSRDHLGKMWTYAERTRFITAFIRRLYVRQGSLVDGQRREPIFVALDEAARYIPQQIPKTDADLVRSVAAWEQLVEEGRNVGIGVGLFTQRSARLNKSVAELADAMIAFRTVGPNSIDAIIDWLGEHVPRADQRAMIEQVRKLPVGTALVVSPGWLEHEGVVAMRARETFDSSVTPKPGERARRVVGSGATVDLDAYRERMAAVVEEAKQSDVKALRAELRQAQQERAQGVGDHAATLIREQALREQKDQLTAEVDRLTRELAERPAPVGLSDDAVEIIQRLDMALIEVGDRIRRESEYVTKVLVDSGEAKVAAARSAKRGLPRPKTALSAPFDAHSASRDAQSASQGRPTRPKSSQVGQPTSQVGHDLPHAEGEHDASLSGMARKILTALAQHGPRTQRKIASLTGYSAQGAFARTITALRASGYIEGTGEISITGAGLGALGPYDPLPTGRALVEHWLARLNTMEAKILTVLVDEYPESIAPAEIAARLDYSSQGAFARAVTRLRKIDLVGHGAARGTVKANDTLGEAWSR